MIRPSPESPITGCFFQTAICDLRSAICNLRLMRGIGMIRPRRVVIAALACLALCNTGAAADLPGAPSGRVKPNASMRVAATLPNPGTSVSPNVIEPTPLPPTPAKPSSFNLPWSPTADDLKGLKSVALIGLFSLAPAVVLMFTSFVRINIVLILLRQALGSPQVPGNQVLTALAILLSALVMKPVAETVYKEAIQPYAAGNLTPMGAWEVGSTPIKVFMVNQIRRTDHVDYLWDLYDIAEPDHPSRVLPVYPKDFPLRVVAPAFLLSELTTALTIGFLIYLPFLVVDLVVSAVLSAMGLFMLPPTLVAMPLKLILFVLADGWMLVASALLRTFTV